MNPIIIIKNKQKSNINFLSENNPNLKESILHYAKMNLENLSSKLLYFYLDDQVLPALLRQR